MAKPLTRSKVRPHTCPSPAQRFSITKRRKRLQPGDDTPPGRSRLWTTVVVVLSDYNGWWAPLTHLFYSNTSR